MDYNYDYFKKAAAYIEDKVGCKLDIGLVLGSALGPLAEEIENPLVIDYRDIPNFLLSTVESHAGKLIIGDLAGKKVICMSGRFHYYEGYDFEDLVIPIRVLHLLGVEKLILTNAAGAVNTSYKTGEIMIIKDHINLMGASPLRGKNLEEFGPRFFDLSNTYDKDLREIARVCADKLGLKVQEGVYFYTPGPHFETPAEIRAIRILGGDAVGMSTITEALTGAHCGMKVLGLSLMTNMAAGVLDQAITTEEVDETGAEAAHSFRKFIREIVKAM